MQKMRICGLLQIAKNKKAHIWVRLSFDVKNCR